MKFLKFFTRVILKSVREDWFLTVLSILGIGLGIGLFMGVNLATNRAIASFEANISGIDPAFNYEVVDRSGIDFPAGVYKPVRQAASRSLPVLTANVYFPVQETAAEITGIYSVKAFAAFDALPDAALDVDAFFRRLNSVIVTRRFSEQHAFRQGDTIPALVYNREYRLTVAGILDLPSVPANTLLMDLGNFQEYFNKVGFLSRIDVMAGGQEAAAIEQMLPAQLTIQPKEKVLRNRTALVDSFRYNLRFITFLAVLVGVFLLYNTVFISVVKRRTEIGMLRGLGMNKSTVVALFCAQGMLLGLVGAVLGIAFGRLSVWFSTSAVEKTVTRFYGATAASDYAITAMDALSTIALGLAVSFGASLIPALEAANVRPMESARAGTVEKAYRKRQHIFSLVGGFLVLTGALIILVDYRYVPFDFPWLSHAGVLLFILGFTLNAPAYLGWSLKFLKPPLSRFFPSVGRIALGDLSGTRYRFSLALMSVAISSALILAIVSSVHSLKSSFIDWINTYVSADIYIKPASCTSNFCFFPLPEEVVKTVEQQPGVETTGRFRALQIDFRGSPVIAGFGDSELLWKYDPAVDREEKERLERLQGRREVNVSDYLSVKYGLKEGDSISIPTPKGEVPFTINSTSISYSTMSGFLYFDRRWLREYWGLDDTTQLSVYLSEGQDIPLFIQRLRKSIGKTYALDITDNSELRQAVLRIFDRSFAVTYTIELIAIVISFIGVVNALLILVLEKKREISVLRYLGASWGHIRRVMVLSAGIIGTAGIVLGIAMGSVISIVITHVTNKISFGWEVSFQVPLITVSLLMAFLLITTVFAGIVPFSLARRIDPKAYISFE